MSAPEPPKRRDWVRDLPMLAGMVVAAAVMFASATIDSGLGRTAPRLDEPAREAADLSAERQAAVESIGAEEPVADAEVEEPRGDSKRSKPKKSAKGDDLNARELEKLAATKAPKRAKDDAPAASKEPEPKQADAPAEEEPAPPVESKPIEVEGKSAQATVGDVGFAISGSSHAPRVGERWELAVAAMRGDEALPGSIRSHAMFQGKVVHHVDTARMKKTGYKLEIEWPEKAVGYPVTIRVIVRAGGQTQTFFFDVKVKPAA